MVIKNSQQHYYIEGHAPLSPQSSVTSSGSGSDTHDTDQHQRNTFLEECSGMKGKGPHLNISFTVPVHNMLRNDRENWVFIFTVYFYRCACVVEEPAVAQVCISVSTADLRRNDDSDRRLAGTAGEVSPSENTHPMRRVDWSGTSHLWAARNIRGTLAFLYLEF